jgi:hypothetical protein
VSAVVASALDCTEHLPRVVVGLLEPTADHAARLAFLDTERQQDGHAFAPELVFRVGVRRRAVRRRRSVSFFGTLLFSVLYRDCHWWQFELPLVAVFTAMVGSGTVTVGSLAAMSGRRHDGEERRKGQHEIAANAAEVAAPLKTGEGAIGGPLGCGTCLPQGVEVWIALPGHHVEEEPDRRREDFFAGRKFRGEDDLHPPVTIAERPDLAAGFINGHGAAPNSRERLANQGRLGLLSRRSDPQIEHASPRAPRKRRRGFACPVVASGGRGSYQLAVLGKRVCRQ